MNILTPGVAKYRLLRANEIIRATDEICAKSLPYREELHAPAGQYGGWVIATWWTGHKAGTLDTLVVRRLVASKAATQPRAEKATQPAKCSEHQ